MTLPMVLYPSILYEWVEALSCDSVNLYFLCWQMAVVRWSPMYQYAGVATIILQRLASVNAVTEDVFILRREDKLR